MCRRCEGPKGLAAQIARDIAAAAAHVETWTESALREAWEAAAQEAWPEWTGPDLTLRNSSR